MSIETRDAAAVSGPSSLMISLLAFATGALVANLYFSQPLIAQIAPAIGVPLDLAGTVVSITQIGYGVGLFLIVSLADLVENKRLVLITLGGLILALIATALSSSAAVFFIASLVIGITCTGAQILVPFAAHLTPMEARGRVVGNVMAGLLTGILLARPAALFVSAMFGWRSVFFIGAGLMVIIAFLLYRLMPRYKPQGGMSYGRVLGSMFELLRTTPVLRRRAAYQSLVFCGFSLFWTASPLMLADRFGLNQIGIALFALAGAGGALAAPIAGRLGDRGYAVRGTPVVMALLTLSFLGTIWAVSAGQLAILAVLAVLLDAAVQGNQIFSQRILFSLPADIRGRVNAVYMTAAFFGGAVGSTLATATYRAAGWPATAAVGCAVGLIALLLFTTEWFSQPKTLR